MEKVGKGSPDYDRRFSFIQKPKFSFWWDSGEIDDSYLHGLLAKNNLSADIANISTFPDDLKKSEF